MNGSALNDTVLYLVQMTCAPSVPTEEVLIAIVLKPFKTLYSRIPFAVIPGEQPLRVGRMA